MTFRKISLHSDTLHTVQISSRLRQLHNSHCSTILSPKSRFLHEIIMSLVRKGKEISKLGLGVWRSAMEPEKWNYTVSRVCGIELNSSLIYAGFICL